MAKKITFIYFDYSQAGVYGSEEWKKLEAFDNELSEKFDNIVEQLEMNGKK